VGRVLDTLVRRVGYRGYASLEMCHKDLYEQALSVPKRIAERAYQSWTRTLEFLGSARSQAQEVDQSKL
jgi:hypothetical protein